MGTGLQRFTEWRQRELGGSVFFCDESKMCECSHEASERRRMSLGGSCQLVSTLRSTSQMVGDTQLGGDVEDMGHPMRGGHVDQLRMRGKFGVSGSSVAHSNDLRFA